MEDLLKEYDEERKNAGGWWTCKNCGGVNTIHSYDCSHCGGKRGEVYQDGIRR